VDNVVIDFFDLRLSFKGGGYVIVEKATGPRSGRWHLTVPTKPLETGQDQGLIRPHLSRRRGRKKERRGFALNSLKPVAVNGDSWEGVLKFTGQDAAGFIASLQERLRPIHEELASLRHHHDEIISDAWLREHLVAVYVSDPALEESLQPKMREEATKTGRYVVNRDTMQRSKEERSACWQPPDQLRALEPGSPDDPIAVMVRCSCGRQREMAVFRSDQGNWIERSHCSGSDEEQDEVFKRHLGLDLADAYRTLVRMLGFQDLHGEHGESPAAQGAPRTSV